MNTQNLTGYYSYRSFLDNPNGSPNEILFGAGELFLVITDDKIINGTLAFPMNQLEEFKEFMDITGEIISINPLKLRFIGKGRKNSAIEEFEYEYDCTLSHLWDSSTPPQTLTLTGTVRRNKDHGQSKAGITASFIAVKREFTEPKDIPGVALIPEALKMLGDRKHRLIHTVWHTARFMWNSLNEEEKEKIKKLNWFFYDPPFNQDGSLNLLNGAGEDFLYMHRRMIKMVNDIYDKKGLERPTSWKEIPEPNTPHYFYDEVPNPTNPVKATFKLNTIFSGQMVPPPSDQFMKQVESANLIRNAFLRSNKTPRGFQSNMFPISNNLRNRNIVGQLTLSAYGNLIEFTVHNWMHMRWAGISRNPVTNQPEVRNSFDINPMVWDNIRYDYLGDFHSSHVNPIFWKLHGWVDDCIDFWFETHENLRPGQVRKKVVRGIEWFEKGNWVLKDNPFDWPNAEHHDHGHHHHEIKELEQVMQVLKDANDRITNIAGLIEEKTLSANNLPSIIQFGFRE